MRLLLFLLYYAIAFLMGFVIRARFDTWMYSKPHMQERLVIWAADTVTYIDSGGPGPVLPPETTDAEAFSPVLGQTRIGRLARTAAGAGGRSRPGGLPAASRRPRTRVPAPRRRCGRRERAW